MQSLYKSSKYRKAFVCVCSCVCTSNPATESDNEHEYAIYQIYQSIKCVIKRNKVEKRHREYLIHDRPLILKILFTILLVLNSVLCIRDYFFYLHINCMFTMNYPLLCLPKLNSLLKIYINQLNLFNKFFPFH